MKTSGASLNLTTAQSMAVRWFVFVAVAFLTGCAKVELHSNLDEQQANEMMSILLSEKIECEKTPGEEGTWNLGVPQDDFSRAVMKLREQGYPKQKFAGIGDVFQRNGLVSSPTEERIRFMHALSQELSATITQIDGVLSARVHIVLPNNNPFGDTIQPSSASVFVRHRPGIDLTTKIPEMTRLVVGSIEGLEYDKVSTVLFAAEEVQVPQVEQAATTDIEFLSITVGRDSLPRLLVVAGALLLITVTSVIALIVTFIRSRVRITPKVAVSARNATARPMTA